MPEYLLGNCLAVGSCMTMTDDDWYKYVPTDEHAANHRYCDPWRCPALLKHNRPPCAVCGDWDETVRARPVTKSTDALLCATCGDNDEVLRTLEAGG